MLKKCSKCLVEKEVSCFHKSKNSKDGYVSHCKNCRKIKSKDDYHLNKNDNKLDVTGMTCVVCQVFKEVSEFHKQIGTKCGYRSTCKKCRSNDFKISYHNSPDKHKEKTKKYRINNKEKINRYFNERYRKIPHVYAWRGMLSSVIRRLGKKKESTTYELLGYSAEQLREHIEKLFTHDMSWDNWGEWHIDHIIPITKFDKDTDPKVVNSLENLQPLWKSDNIRKSNV